MVEISDETRRTISELVTVSTESKHRDIKSHKRRRHAESKSVLGALKIKHGEVCHMCTLDCEVKRKEDPDFWANMTGDGNDVPSPIYRLETCPKQGRLERARVKMKRVK